MINKIEDLEDDPLKIQTGETEGTEIKKFGYEYKKCGIVGCNKDTVLCCHECKTVFYCNVQHQRHGWKFHKQICSTIRFTKKLKCPLTKCFFLEPVKNSFCGHVFEKQAILSFIKKDNNKCPFDNCEKYITKSSLKPDRYMKQMVVTYLYTIDYRHAPTIGVEYLLENKVVNRNSRVGIFYEKRENIFTVRVLYIGRNTKIMRRELFFKFNRFLKMISLVNQFMRRNDSSPDPKDFPTLVYNGEVIDLKFEAREIGVKDGVTFFIQFPSDIYDVKYYDENIDLKKEMAKLKKENIELKKKFTKELPINYRTPNKKEESEKRRKKQPKKKKKKFVSELQKNFDIAKRLYPIHPKYCTKVFKKLEMFNYEMSHKNLI